MISHPLAGSHFILFGGRKNLLSLSRIQARRRILARQKSCLIWLWEGSFFLRIRHKWSSEKKRKSTGRRRWRNHLRENRTNWSLTACPPSRRPRLFCGIQFSPPHSPSSPSIHSSIRNIKIRQMKRTDWGLSFSVIPPSNQWFLLAESNKGIHSSHWTRWSPSCWYRYKIDLLLVSKKI